MKAILVMFDSLNRRALSTYGATGVATPNFDRLARRSLTFDNSYCCSMPCMPARRDFHTGRPNFLHRSWGPLEPYDWSVPQMLGEHGVYTHLISDHHHYWEEGGANYHARYTSWENVRGQEGDNFLGQVAEVPPPEDGFGQEMLDTPYGRQYRRHEPVVSRPEMYPANLTFAKGLDFIDRNARQDNWLLHLEAFDPHEPFLCLDEHLNADREFFANYKGRRSNWPVYGAVKESAEEVEYVRRMYAALVRMCDQQLGRVLDAMDRHGLWEDTLLVVWTDHGFLLSEHGLWGKNDPPLYNEVCHTPFFVWDPRQGKAGERRQALVQPSIDLGPTLLRAFDLEVPAEMLGKDLTPVLAADNPVRTSGIFGYFAHWVNLTDGRYVYMRGREAGRDLHRYSINCSMMREPYPREWFGPELELSEPFKFTRGCRLLKMRTPVPKGLPTLLFDLHADPRQEHPIQDPVVEARLGEELRRHLQAVEAPPEQFASLGLPS